MPLDDRKRFQFLGIVETTVVILILIQPSMNFISELSCFLMFGKAGLQTSDNLNSINTALMIMNAKISV